MGPLINKAGKAGRAKIGKAKAQASIISIVLITGIAVSVIGISYTWGVPLLQKSQTKSETDTAEALMTGIERAIADVAQTGGQKALPINLRGRLELSEGQNSIIYVVSTASTSVADTDWVPLNDDDKFAAPGLGQENFTAILGKDKAGLIVARASQSAGGFDTTYRLVYRELDDLTTLTGYLIQIKAAGISVAQTGQFTLVIKRDEPASSGKSRLGGSLIVTPIEVSLT